MYHPHLFLQATSRLVVSRVEDAIPDLQLDVRSSTILFRT